MDVDLSLRILTPSFTRGAGVDSDVLLEWAPASIVAEDRVGAAELTGSDDV